MNYRLPSLASLFVVACLIPAHAEETKTDEMTLTNPLAKALHSELKSTTAYTHGSDLQRFYKQRNYESVWLDEDGDWKRDPSDIIESINESAAEGLNPKNYALEKTVKQPVPENVAAIAPYELRVTSQVMDYVEDLRYGQVVPASVFPQFFTPDDSHDLAHPTEQVLSAGSIKKGLQAQNPQHPEYAALREALKNYTEIAAYGGWKNIPSGAVIEPGGVDKRIPQIRERLQLLGRLDEQKNMFDRLRDRFTSLSDDTEEDLVEQAAKKEVKEAKENPQWVYNKKLEPAIREFQQRRGAKVDGVIGPETLKELNVPIEERIKQIKLAMEQWRWLPRDLGNKYVFVNTAGYYAKGVENGRVVVDTPVIVGQVAHPTPSFSSYITNVKYYPDWTVPDSIAKRYLLDKIRKNPSVVQSLGYELSDENGTPIPLSQANISRLSDANFPPYRFRQRPGTKNALGLVRFSVDNDYAIYLHDTPKDSLFSEVDRNFSSGCIRVGEPVKMAQFLLAGNSELSSAEAAAKLDVAGRTDLETEIVPLETKIPVHIMYMTAWVDENGNIRFEGDAYSRDNKLATAMGM